MRHTLILTLLFGFLLGCGEPQSSMPAASQKSKHLEVPRFEKLGLKKGMKRTHVEQKVSALLGVESDYTSDPMGTHGGSVTYIDGLWKLVILYKSGSPGETGVDDKGNFTDYTPAIDEEIVSFEIKPLSPTISTLIAPEFGRILTITGEFIGKTDIDGKPLFINHDLVKPYTHADFFNITVLSVDGVKLKDPVQMGYTLDHAAFHPEVGKVYDLYAYETIERIGKPWGWERKPSWYGYQIVNKLVIKPKE